MNIGSFSKKCYATKVVSVLYVQALLCDFDFAPFYILDMREDSDNIRMFGSNYPSKHSHNYNRRLLPCFYLLYSKYKMFL